jgi:hypothetical protein
MIPLFLVIIGVDSYLISDYIATRNKTLMQPDIQGVATVYDSREEESTPTETPAPSAVVIQNIDKRSVKNISNVVVSPTITQTPSPTPSPTLTPTPTSIIVLPQ